MKHKIPEVEKIKKVLSHFLYMDGLDRNAIYFDTSIAKQRPISSRLIRIGQYINKLKPQMVSGLKIPIYGNWCGPGHGGGKPVDRLDAGCMRHDLCYKKRGWGSCICDQALLVTIRKNWAFMKPNERDYAAAIYTYFSFVLDTGLCSS